MVFNMNTFITLVVLPSAALCAPGPSPYHPYRPNTHAGPSQGSQLNTTLSASSSINVHYRHLRFGHRRYHASTYSPYYSYESPTATSLDTSTSLNLTTSSKPSVVKENPTRVKRAELNTAPTPAPTGAQSALKTIHISDASNFALILPKRPNELISDAESDGEAFCSQSAGNCPNTMPEGFITATAFVTGPTNSDGIPLWTQVTGCFDPSKLSMSASDAGGQFDVRYPNGAMCTHGGYGASFIQQTEPSSRRFCLRCCLHPNDQVNCNSHQDRMGCLAVMPGKYDFPEKGISCV